MVSTKATWIRSGLLNGKPTRGPLSRTTALAVALIRDGVPRDEAIHAAKEEIPGAEGLPDGLLSRSLGHFLEAPAPLA